MRWFVYSLSGVFKWRMWVRTGKTYSSAAACLLITPIYVDKHNEKITTAKLFVLLARKNRARDNIQQKVLMINVYQ